MIDYPNELRCVASDHLKGHDREMVKLAADELEHAYKLLVSTQAALIESQQRRLALSERLSEASRGPLTFSWNYWWQKCPS